MVLRDLIAPYLLRRRKTDVHAQLTKKTEQVLFCNLTPEQRDLYRSYLASEEVTGILEGVRHALSGIDILRKVRGWILIVRLVEKRGAGVERGGGVRDITDHVKLISAHAC